MARGGAAAGSTPGWTRDVRPRAASKYRRVSPAGFGQAQPRPVWPPRSAYRDAPRSTGCVCGPGRETPGTHGGNTPASPANLCSADPIAFMSRDSASGAAVVTDHLAGHPKLAHLARRRPEARFYLSARRCRSSAQERTSDRGLDYGTISSILLFRARRRSAPSGRGWRARYVGGRAPWGRQAKGRAVTANGGRRLTPRGLCADRTVRRTRTPPGGKRGVWNRARRGW